MFRLLSRLLPRLLSILLSRLLSILLSRLLSRCCQDCCPCITKRILCVTFTLCTFLRASHLRGNHAKTIVSLLWELFFKKKELSTALRDSKLKQTNAERGARKQRERFQYQTGLDFVYWQQSEVFTFLSQEGSQSLSQFWRNGSFFFFKWEWKGLFVMELTKFCAVATVHGSFISFHQGGVPRRALNLFATFFIPSKLVASKI